MDDDDIDLLHQVNSDDVNWKISHFKLDFDNSKSIPLVWLVGGVLFVKVDVFCQLGLDFFDLVVDKISKVSIWRLLGSVW